MAYFLLGAISVYLGTALTFWAGCRADTVQDIAAEAREQERSDIARWKIEIVVLWLCLAWPWVLLEAGRKP